MDRVAIKSRTYIRQFKIKNLESSRSNNTKRKLKNTYQKRIFLFVYSSFCVTRKSPKSLEEWRNLQIKIACMDLLVITASENIVGPDTSSPPSHDSQSGHR